MLSAKQACLLPRQQAATCRLPCRPRNLGPCAASSTSPDAPAAASRRQGLLALVLGGGLPWVHAEEASAQSALGRSIQEAWKSRQQANSDILLAPIKVVEQRLQQAMDLLQSSSSSPEQLGGVLQAMRASSLNCYLYEDEGGLDLETRASLATQKFKLGGADPCTLRLIVKNVSGLSPEQERQEGQQLVEQIIRGYQRLDGQLVGAMQVGGSADASQVLDELRAIMRLVVQLEAYVTRVLAV